MEQEELKQVEKTGAKPIGNWEEAGGLCRALPHPLLRPRPSTPAGLHLSSKESVE